MLLEAPPGKKFKFIQSGKERNQAGEKQNREARQKLSLGWIMKRKQWKISSPMTIPKTIMGRTIVGSQPSTKQKSFQSATGLLRVVQTKIETLAGIMAFSLL